MADHHLYTAIKKRISAKMASHNEAAGLVMNCILGNDGGIEHFRPVGLRFICLRFA